jgi:hypothetical protein
MHGFNEGNAPGQQMMGAAGRLAMTATDAVGYADAAAQREPEVQAEYRRLMDVIERALKATVVLCDRLGPVSRPEVETGNKAVPQPGPPCSQIASQLRQASDAVEHLANTLHAQRNRLEI